MQGHVSRHAVAVGKLAGEIHGQLLPLFRCEFGGEGDFHFPRQNGVLPFVVVLRAFQNPARSALPPPGRISSACCTPLLCV